ncbi:imidazoleglycerol-phosphate dehydratase HisB [Deltaproteobacteria bacterium TL4]
MRRYVEIERNTRETSIQLSLDLDGTGICQTQTGIGYFDHMLQQLAFHGLFDIQVQCKGDLQTGSHHSVEDIGITLGEAFACAVGEKKGIKRYAHAYIPMDETLVRSVVDLSGRAEFVFEGKFAQVGIAQLETQMIPHFFKSFAMAAKITLHLSILYGENDHHKCEGLFKAFARSLHEAVQIDPARAEQIASTKGTL